ncbi:MAG: hypothetical protein RL653_3095 [Pseudomonadota bacterium]|jgi:hypothetical protein
MKRACLSVLVVLSTAAFAAEPGDEVELSSAPVTAASCAQKAIETGKLSLLNECPLDQAKTGLVVFDVAERAFYKLDPKSIRTSELERAFGGGSLDVTGKVVRLDTRDKVPVVEVTESRITPKPKAGAFKGCL